MNYTKSSGRTSRHLLSAPFIYSMIFPMVILDISTEIYHRVSFPLYDIDYVNRGKYIKIDRHKLSKLNGMQKINCMYCGYVNGLLHYTSVIAGETEKYWCGIKHSDDADFIPPAHQENFREYTDYL